MPFDIFTVLITYGGLSLGIWGIVEALRTINWVRERVNPKLFVLILGIGFSLPLTLFGFVPFPDEFSTAAKIFGSLILGAVAAGASIKSHDKFLKDKLSNPLKEFLKG